MMTSSPIHYHQTQNHHKRRLMIVPWHKVVFAAATKRKRGELLLAARAENRWRRSTLPRLSPFWTTSLSTLRRKAAQDPNCLTVTMDVDLVSNVQAMTSRSLKRSTRASEELSASGRINQTIKRQSMITPSPRTSARGRNNWQHRAKQHSFDPFDPILTIWFLCNFKLACNNNRIHGRTAMWPLQFFMK